MKWTSKLVTESDSGESTVHEVAILKSTEAFIKPASLGMCIEESKQIAANIQSCMVSAQPQMHVTGVELLRRDRCKREHTSHSGRIYSFSQ
jgi:hypothetical protein